MPIVWHGHKKNVNLYGSLYPHELCYSILEMQSVLASTTQYGTPNVLRYTQATSTIPFLHKGTSQTDNDCTHIIRTVDISTLIQQELYPLLIPIPRCLNQCTVSFLKRSTHVYTTLCDDNMTYCKKWYHVSAMSRTCIYAHSCRPIELDRSQRQTYEGSWDGGRKFYFFITVARLQISRGIMTSLMS